MGFVLRRCEPWSCRQIKTRKWKRFFALHGLLSEAVQEAVAQDHFPLILAGNCSSTVGTVSGLDKEGLGVVWLDAHGDYNTPETTTTGFLDGMALSVLTGMCWERMAEGVPGFEPYRNRESPILAGGISTRREYPDAWLRHVPVGE